MSFVPQFANRTADTDSRAWPAIYGFPNKEGTGNFEKDPQWWNKTVTGVVNILDADDAGHRRMRRLQNPAFSDKALRAQESVICGYASLLAHKLHGLCSGGSAVVDMTAWYNFTTFGMSLLRASSPPFLRLLCFAVEMWRDRAGCMNRRQQVEPTPQFLPAPYHDAPG